MTCDIPVNSLARLTFCSQVLTAVLKSHEFWPLCSGWFIYFSLAVNFQDLWADANRSPAEGRGARPPPRSGSLVKSGRFSKWAFSSWRTSWTFSCLALYSCKQNRCRLTSSQWLECTAISFGRWVVHFPFFQDVSVTKIDFHYFVALLFVGSRLSQDV